MLEKSVYGFKVARVNCRYEISRVSLLWNCRQGRDGPCLPAVVIQGDDFTSSEKLEGPTRHSCRAMDGKREIHLLDRQVAQDLLSKMSALVKPHFCGGPRKASTGMVSTEACLSFAPFPSSSPHCSSTGVCVGHVLVRMFCHCKDGGRNLWRSSLHREVACNCPAFEDMKITEFPSMWEP